MICTCCRPPRLPSSPHITHTGVSISRPPGRTDAGPCVRAGWCARSGVAGRDAETGRSFRVVPCGADVRVHRWYSWHMDGYINASRGAFHVAVGRINELGAEQVGNLAVEALKTLDSPESVAAGDNVLAALVHIYRGARQHQVTADGLGESLQKNTDLTAASTTAVTESWAQWNQSERVPDTFVGVGRFHSMDWKIGVTMDRSSGSLKPEPFVSVVLRVGANNKIVPHHLEMNMDEFHHFQKSMKSMNEILDTL